MASRRPWCVETLMFRQAQHEVLILSLSKDEPDARRAPLRLTLSLPKGEATESSP